MIVFTFERHNHSSAIVSMGKEIIFEKIPITLQLFGVLRNRKKTKIIRNQLPRLHKNTLVLVETLGFEIFRYIMYYNILSELI